LTVIKFQVVALAFDWTFPGRAEMVKSALDVLNVCAALPKAQAQFCETVDLPEVNKPVGINILLSAAEGEIVQVSYSFFLIGQSYKEITSYFCKLDRLIIIERFSIVMKRV